MTVFGVKEYNYFLDTCLKQITSRSYDEIEEDNVGEIIEFLIKNGFTVCECSVIIPFPIHQEDYIVPTDAMYHFCAWIALIMICMRMKTLKMVHKIRYTKSMRLCKN